MTEQTDAGNETEQAEALDAIDSQTTLRESLLFMAGIFLLGVAVLIWMVPEALLGDIPAVLDGSEELIRIGIAGFIFLSIFAVRFTLPVTPVHPVSPRREFSEPLDETSGRVIQPGVDIDSKLTEVAADYETFEAEHEQLTAHLHELAVQTLTHYQNIPEGEAQERLETGSWTDNRTAAALFIAPEKRSYRMRIRFWLSPRETYRRQVEAAVAALKQVSQS